MAKKLKQEQDLQQPAPLSRGAVPNVKMCCKTEQNEWNFKADDTPDAIEKARKICADNGFHFPSDVVVWEITQRS